ncbi:MAG: hypothetical protein WC004_01750 [Candidatus Absconditabacterales bacterium]
MADGLETAGFESIQNTGNESGEVSQEDLIRVNEQLGESRKYRGMIGSSVATNSKLAEFLKHLIVQVNSNEFRDALDCFYVKTELGEAIFLSTTFCACMAPLYAAKADELALQELFAIDYHVDTSFHAYLQYIQKLFAHDKESRKVNEKKFLIFLKLVISLRSLQPEDKSALGHITIDALSGGSQ